MIDVLTGRRLPRSPALSLQDFCINVADAIHDKFSDSSQGLEPHVAEQFLERVRNTRFQMHHDYHGAIHSATATVHPSGYYSTIEDIHYELREIKKLYASFRKELKPQEGKLLLDLLEHVEHINSWTTALSNVQL